LKINLSNISKQNTDLKNTSIESLNTINSLRDKLDKSLRINKQRRIDLLKQMNIEIENDLDNLKISLLNDKEMYLNGNLDNYKYPTFRFITESIKINLSEATITNNVSLLNELYELNKRFTNTNMILNANVGQSNDIKVANMKTIFSDYDRDNMLKYKGFCNRLEEYIVKVEKENK